MTRTDETLWIYDTTLRDGAQREGIALSVADKRRIAAHLDDLAIPFIEGGWPGANPKDIELFRALADTPPRHAAMTAFGATRRPGREAAEEPLLRTVLEARTDWVTVFGKSWTLHVTEGLRTTREENLAMIRDTVAFFTAAGRQVVYDAEHFFDGYHEDAGYALATLEAARDAGAAWIVPCDTNGGSLPETVRRMTETVREATPAGIGLGIHTHDDSGLAIANSLAAVQAGARMVQGTLNGYGERCGNANLCTLIPLLQLKLGYRCVPPETLAQLTELSHEVSEIVNIAPDDHAPFVGRSAFAHKGGIHVSAVRRNPRTYEHIPPEAVGNDRRIVVSEQSGVSNVVEQARRLGLTLDPAGEHGRRVLERLKVLEQEGYQFEAAEASFELLVEEVTHGRPHYFGVRSYQVTCDMASDCPDQGTRAMAHVKIAVAGEEVLEAAEGSGPVAALDAALRRGLNRFYPTISAFRLTDYKVRILDSRAGTGAKTRVLVESSDGHQRWTTLGVSENIIEASYHAVIEGLEYGLWKSGQRPLNTAAEPAAPAQAQPTDPIDPPQADLTP